MNEIEDFRMALQHAQVEGIKYLEVTEKLFKYLYRGQPETAYLTVGQPGVKVFIEGTRKGIEDVDNMSAELHHDYVIKQKSKKLNG